METQNTNLSAVEAKIIVDDFLTRTKPITDTRADTFAKYERFILDGEQWDVSETVEGDKPQLTFNQSEDFITTYMSKLFPRNGETGIMEIGIKSKATDQKTKESEEREILDVYEKNKLPQTLLEQGQNFFVGGAGCLYYPKDPVTGQAKIISLDPASCFLGWSGSRLTQFAFKDEISLAEAKITTKDGWLTRALTVAVDFLTGESTATKKFKPVERITYWDEEHQIIKIGDTCEVKTNEDKLIPFSWIPNNKKSHRHEGRSEAKMIRDLEKEYNKRMSDFGARVKENTKPVLAAFTDMETKDLDRDELNGILPFGKDDKADFLKLPENVEILKYTETIANRMAVKFGINEAVQGAIKSNVSSLAMVYYFSPLLDRIGLKRIYWDEAFRELNRAILTYKFGTTREYRTDPVYQPIMVTDTETKIKNTVLMLENHLISYRDAIDILRGSENANQKFEEIKNEFEELKKIDGFMKNANTNANDVITL